MILLFGGTSETAPVAESVAGAGYRVLVSTATDIELDVGNHPRIQRRSGRLNGDGIAGLILEYGVRGIVDATHPFALDASATVSQAADKAGVEYFRFSRKGGEYDYENTINVDSHEEAARIAFSFGKPALLAIGSKNVGPYANESRRTGLGVAARVLDHPSSIESCHAAGLTDKDIIAERGPFTVEQNIGHINTYGSGVIVTKDSGKAGGVPEKIEAARQAGIYVILVNRPDGDTGRSFSDISDLIQKLTGEIPLDENGQ